MRAGRIFLIIPPPLLTMLVSPNLRPFAGYERVLPPEFLALPASRIAFRRSSLFSMWGDGPISHCLARLGIGAALGGREIAFHQHDFHVLAGSTVDRGELLIFSLVRSLGMSRLLGFACVAQG